MPEDPKQNMLAQIAEAEAKGDLSHKAMLEKILKNFVDVPQQATAQKITSIKNNILSASRPEEIVYSLIPHEMAKVSIFFPMSDQELRADRRIMQKIETESKWGRAVVRGVKLSIFEEDVVLALLTLAKTGLNPTNTELILDTSLPKIAKFLYSSKDGYNQKTYASISQAVQNLGLINFTISLYTSDGITKKIGKEVSVSSIIQSYVFNAEGKTLRIKFNPDFFLYLGSSNLTSINFSLRRHLKKAGSKALLRFLATHRNPSKMQMITVLNAINFNTKQPLFTLRRFLKNFITELKKHGVLGPKTKLYPDDLVYFDVVTKKNHSNKTT